MKPLELLDKWGKKFGIAGVIIAIGPAHVVNFFYTVFGAIWSTIEAVGLEIANLALEVEDIIYRFRWAPFYMVSIVIILTVIGIWTGFKPLIASAGLILGLSLLFIWALATGLANIVGAILQAGKATVGTGWGLLVGGLKLMGIEMSPTAGDGFDLVDPKKVKGFFEGAFDLIIPALLLYIMLWFMPTWKVFGTLPGLLLIILTGSVLTVSAKKDTLKMKLFWLRMLNYAVAGIVLWSFFAFTMPKTAAAVGNRTKTTDQMLGDLVKGDWKNMTCNQRIDLLDKTGAVKDSLKAGEQFVMCSSMDTTFGGTNYKLTFHVTPAGPKWAGYAWESLIKKNAEKGWEKITQSILSAQQAAAMAAGQQAVQPAGTLASQTFAVVIPPGQANFDTGAMVTAPTGGVLTVVNQGKVNAHGYEHDANGRYWGYPLVPGPNSFSLMRPMGETLKIDSAGSDTLRLEITVKNNV